MEDNKLKLKDISVHQIETALEDKIRELIGCTYYGVYLFRYELRDDDFVYAKLEINNNPLYQKEIGSNEENIESIKKDLNLHHLSASTIENSINEIINKFTESKEYNVSLRSVIFDRKENAKETMCLDFTIGEYYSSANGGW